jgi:hypothetical protein
MSSPVFKTQPLRRDNQDSGLESFTAKQPFESRQLAREHWMSECDVHDEQRPVLVCLCWEAQVPAGG